MLTKEKDTRVDDYGLEKNSQEEVFLGTRINPEIKNEEERTVYDLSKFDFLNEEQLDEDLVNANLWNHSKKVNEHGLFQIWEDKIYQIRNFNLANLTLIRSNKGWIAVDVLGDSVTVRAAIQLAERELGEDILNSIRGIIVTHSHVDHFGGVKGLATQEQIGNDVDDIKFYAPKGFYEHAISENLMGGNTMGRRAQYMYGSQLDPTQNGTVGVGLGQGNSSEPYGILRPSLEIGHNISLFIDDIEFDFMYTPDSEAPSEMIFYINNLDVICQGELVNKTMHNLYTLRGAKVRSGLLWSRYINQAINKWGTSVKMSFGTHHWPTYTQSEVVAFWCQQRDLYRFMHDQSLRLANQGYTPDEIAEEIKELPIGLRSKMQNHGFYGTLSHNLKAQYQLYFGWFDGNPAKLNPLTPVEAARKYIEYMGDEADILLKAHVDFEQGNYRWVAELLNHVVFSNPHNTEARELLANTYTKLGSVAESGPWRNFYLTGAKELLNPAKGQVMSKKQHGTTPGIVDNLSLQHIGDYFATRFNGNEHGSMSLNFKFKILSADFDSNPDSQESTRKEISDTIYMYVGNGVLIPNTSRDLNCSDEIEVVMLRSDLNLLFLESVTIDELINDSRIRVFPEDKLDDFRAFTEAFVAFDPSFNIVEP